MTEREKFEKFFKKWHPDKTGPYIKDIMWYAYQAATKSAAPQWIPVSERLPDDYSMSICVGHGGYQFICRKEPNGWFRFPQMKKLDGVTHWMPLPAAPEQPE